MAKMGRPSEASKITLPNNWVCRPHQEKVWDYMMAGGKRAVVCWHRRAGKDSVGINLMATLMHKRKGLYYYMAPTQAQARKIVWDNLGEDGIRIIDQAIPKALRSSTNDQNMRIVTKYGSIFQVLGSDNHDSIMGANPVGIVFSEWALATKPEAWDFLRPILAENGGWAFWPYTPRGLNHGYTTYNIANTRDEWFCERLTVEDTGVLTQEQIQNERDEGMSEAKIQQEFYCEFLQDTEKQIFNMKLTMEAMARTAPVDDPGAACIAGIDLAREGDDRSVIVTRIGKDFKSVPPLIYNKLDAVAMSYRIAEYYGKYKPDALFLDATGYGAGVYDICRKERRIPVTAINFGQKAQHKDRYYNKRAEMHDRFADWLMDPDVALTDSQPLREELASIMWTDPDANGRLKVMKKEKIKQITGVSPDITDAHVLTFAEPVYRKDVRRGGNNGPRLAIMED